MRLQIRGGLDDILRTDHPPHAPTRHRIGLRNTIQNDATLGERRNEHRHGCRLRIVIEQVFVDLVGDDPHAVFVCPLANRLHLCRCVDRTGWVRRRAEQQHLRLRSARCFELFNRDEVILRFIGDDFDRITTGEADALRICRPVRRRQQDVVARINDAGECLVHRLLATVRDEHLRSIDLVA